MKRILFTISLLLTLTGYSQSSLEPYDGKLHKKGEVNQYVSLFQFPDGFNSKKNYRPWLGGNCIPTFANDFNKESIEESLKSQNIILVDIETTEFDKFVSEFIEFTNTIDKNEIACLNEYDLLYIFMFDKDLKEDLKN